MRVRRDGRDEKPPMLPQKLQLTRYFVFGSRTQCEKNLIIIMMIYNNVSSPFFLLSGDDVDRIIARAHMVFVESIRFRLVYITTCVIDPRCTLACI